MSIQAIAAEVKVMEAKLVKAKDDKARLAGRLDELYNRLTEEFGLSTLEEAASELARLNTELQEGETRIEGMFTRLKEKHNWEAR